MPVLLATPPCRCCAGSRYGPRRRSFRISTHLLHAAYRNADRQSFLELIAERLAHSSMTVAQRVHWLGNGRNRLPATATSVPCRSTCKTVRGVSRILPSFFCGRGRPSTRLTVPAQKYYVGLLGSTLGRWSLARLGRRGHRVRQRGAMCLRDDPALGCGSRPGGKRCTGRACGRRGALLLEPQPRHCPRPPAGGAARRSLPASRRRAGLQDPGKISVCVVDVSPPPP